MTPTKLLAPLVFAALLVGLWVLPPADDARLAELAAAQLLDHTVEGAEETLAEHVLARAERTPAGLRLHLAASEPQSTALERSLLAGLLARSPAPMEVAYAPDGGRFRLELEDARETLTWSAAGSAPARVRTTFLPPGKSALLPPLLAIAAAVLFRRTVWALFLGVFTGAVLLQLRTGARWTAVPEGFVDIFRVFLWERLGNLDNTRTILFVVLMLSMVGLMVRSGGLTGVMEGVARRAQSARGSQIAAWVMGLLVFFDDYSNTVLVGSTMRPLTDRFRVAREKLAYIVDSTAAPVAGLSLFSTWIAFEVSTFAPQLPLAGLPASAGYAVFLETLPFRFYSILTLVLVGLVVLSGRDFGPMRRAEERARSGLLMAPGSKPMMGPRSTSITPSPKVVPHAVHALAPLVGFVAVTVFTIVFRGGAFALSVSEFFSLPGISGVLLAGSGTVPLLVGSTTGFVLAALGCVRAGIGREIPSAAVSVLTSMGTAFAILYLAWMIGSVCRELDTASYLAAQLSEGLPPLLLPALLFLLSSLVAFATGSSWSTMMILLPLVVGLAFDLGGGTTLGGSTMVLMSIGAVLEGSIFGDHCSPLSDTTVLSSISSASDHIDHVRTQAPYALLTMGAAMVFGYLPCAFFGLSPYLGLLLGASALGLFLFVAGRPAGKST